MELYPGDCTFQSKFDKLTFVGDSRVTGTFKPPRGRRFAVLLLGDVAASATDFDIEAALNDLGFYRRDVESPNEKIGAE